MPKLNVTFTDINGQNASTSFYCAQADADNVLGNLDALSNAQITNATITLPVDLAAAAGAPVAANVETALAKLKVTCTGPAPAGSNKQLSSTTFTIPAPVGAVVNAPEGDPLNANLVAIMGIIQSEDGAAMTQIKSVRYARAR